MTLLLSLILIVGLVTGILDLSMNGGRNAGWAPWGIGSAVVSLLVLFLIGGVP